MARDVYISIDIEADGPIPGPTGWGYSMLSLGAAVAGVLDEETGFSRVHPTAETFYVELRPISDDWVPEALAVCESALHHSRADLLTLGQDPAEAMTAFSDWVGTVAAGHGGKPVALAWPSSWDYGTYLYWYLTRFTGGSPFSHGWHRDIRTTFADRAGLPIRSVGKHTVPAGLLSRRRHTHNALDDAIEQGELFANIMGWAPPP